MLRSTIFIIASLIITTPWPLTAEGTIENRKLSSDNYRVTQTPQEYGKVKYSQGKNIYKSPYADNQNLTFSFYGAYTLWVPYQEGLAVGKSLSSSATNSFLFPKISPVGGLIARVSKLLYFDDWKATVDYTWFYNPNNLRQNSVPGISTYTSQWTVPENQSVNSISSSFSNQFNRISGKIDRMLAVGKKFFIAPWIGLTGAWEDQHLEVEIEVNNTKYQHTKNTQYWWCVGPYYGLDIVSKLSTMFSINSKIGTSINLSKIIQTNIQKENSSPSYDSGSVIIDMDNYQWNVEPMIEGMISLNYNKDWNDFAIEIECGWLLQTWFSHNNFINSNSSSNNTGNYSMQGLVIMFGFSV